MEEPRPWVEQLPGSGHPGGPQAQPVLDTGILKWGNNSPEGVLGNEKF